MRLALITTVAGVLCAHVAFCDVIIYKFSTVEHFIGNGLDKRRSVRGSVIIDLNTFDLSLVGTSIFNRQKEMFYGTMRSVDIQTVTGAVGITHTVISMVENSGSQPGASTFTLTYARGADSLIEWAPGEFAMWPRRMTFLGSGISTNDGALHADEGVGTMTLLAKDTIEANRLGLNRAQIMHRLVNHFEQLGYVQLASPSLAAGRVVVSHDDLVLAESGFHDPSDPGTFAQDVAAWFTGGRAGRFLAYTDNQGFTGSSLINAMTTAGHTWVVSTSAPLTVSNLLSFDGIFLCGHPIDGNDLSSYVNAGGNVYVAGTGVANVDMTMWNTFLQGFGLAFANSGTGVADFSVSSDHPIFAGVDHLYGVNGTSIIALQPSTPATGVVVTNGGTGLFAVWEQTNLLSGWRRWFSPTPLSATSE